MLNKLRFLEVLDRVSLELANLRGDLMSKCSLPVQGTGEGDQGSVVLTSRTATATQVPASQLGCCRRRAPTLNGWLVVYMTDWCGLHMLGERKVKAATVKCSGA